MNDNLTTNIRRRHKWDNPNDKISATCIKCGCRRFAEKFSTGMSWVYIQKGKVVELTAVPACVLHRLLKNFTTMLVPFAYEPTPEERYKRSYLSSLKKAKHLSERMKQFLTDIEKSKMKEKDKKAIKDEALKFFNCL